MEQHDAQELVFRAGWVLLDIPGILLLGLLAAPVSYY